MKMSITRILLNHFLHSYASRQPQEGSGSGKLSAVMGRLRPSTADIAFLVIASTLLVVFVVVAIVEIFTATPIAKWVTDAWNAVLGTSPQNLINGQLPAPQQLSQTTVGDVLGGIGRVIAAPFDVFLASIIVVGALFVRLRGFLGKVVSSQRKRSFGAVAWGLVAVSFVPVALDYFVW